MIRALLTAAYLLLLAALWYLPADARMHAPYRGHRIVPGGGAPPLDGLTTPLGAYSFRKLITAYAGPAVRLRRASDNLELDIGFLGCTGFTGCPWDEAAAVAHCAATTCWGRVTGYDQSGAGLNQVQATAANQPQLIFGCNGALPCWRYTASTQISASSSITPATGNMSYSMVARRTGGTTGGCVWIRVGATNRVSASSGVANQWALVGGTGSILSPSAGTEGVWHAAQAVIGGAASNLTIDGTALTGTVTGSVVAGTLQTAGGTSNVCEVAEVIVWDNYTLTLPEQAALTANQRAYFGTP